MTGRTEPDDGSTPAERFARGDDDEPMTLGRSVWTFGPEGRPAVRTPPRRRR